MKYFSKILASFLYVIPILFFTICYFLITTSAEDINQGAGQTAHILREIKEAFFYNPRLGELYTWPFINLFDYQFSFGIDTLLRIFDVIMIVAILFAMFVISVGKLPKLALKDSIIFSLGFTLIILSVWQYSEVFYARFSFIHNYLMIILFFLLFILPYALEIHRKISPKAKWFLPVSLILGFLFGMSSQVTPIAFILCFTVITGYWVLKNKQFNYKKIFSNWKTYSLLGIFLALFVMYGLGPGIASHYANDPQLNYVALSDLLSAPIESIQSILSNLIGNVWLMTPYILLFAVMAYISLRAPKKGQSVTSHETSIKFIVYAAVFSIIHLGIMSQIQLESLQRTTLPIYIVVILVTLFTLRKVLQNTKDRLVSIIGIILSLLCLFITIDMTVNQIAYRNQSSVVLKAIQESPSTAVCVEKESIKTPTSVFGFRQSPLLEEWAMPMDIYSKSVTFCDKN